ncbi:MAG: SUMF1/EgtB/PvdO family nonheme iron enzyme [Nitrospinaceae bacterium]
MKYKFFLSSLLAAVFLWTAGPGMGTENPRENPLEGDMVLIPAGQFLFGTNKKDEAAEALSLGIPKPWYADERPQQKVFLKNFYIDRYEVTNRRYKIYLDDVEAIPPPSWEKNNYPPGQDDYPVAWVTWFDAANFCQWAGKQLPSEKQWERAARGKNGAEYPWGNTFDPAHANLSPKAGSKNLIVPVGSFPQGASPEGVQDLIGNVWEWVADDYATYKGSTYQSEFFNQGLKVIRGSSARNIGHFPGPSYTTALEKFSRSGYRQFADPDEPAPDVGFRCVSLEKPVAMKMASASNSASGGAAPPGPGSAKSNPFKSTNSASLSVSPSGGAAPSKTFNPFEAKPQLPQSGLLVLTLLAFFAGVFSFLSPCTLPILPAYFAITAQTDRTRISLMSLAFFIGLATLFVAMGASASLIGQVLRNYLFSLTTIGGGLVALFGVMTLFGKGFSGASFQGRPASTFFGFFLFGATFALGWTPCVGPILSGILILAASDKTVFEGMNLLFFYAVGLGLPLILISTFCGHLPKDGLFWRLLRGKGWDVAIGGRTLHLHTTNLFSGLLLITLGIALAMGYITYLNSMIPIELQLWFSGMEDKFLHWFM